MTMLLFILSVGIFLSTFYIKKVEVQWLAMFLAVCSIAITLLDSTLSNDEMTVLIIIPFFTMLLSGRNAFMNKG